MINPFAGNGFTLTALTASINGVKYKPSLIGSLGIFDEKGINSANALVEVQDGVLTLVNVAPRNGVPQAFGSGPRRGYPFLVPHLPANAAVYADEVMGVRKFGSEDEAETVEAKVEEKLEQMRQSIEYTIESHRLVAIKGNFIDNNGNEISLATTFGVTPPAAIAFDLDDPATEVSDKCLQVLESIEAGLDGLSFDDVKCFCGKNFFAKLISHPSVKETLLNTPQAPELRSDPRQSIRFGGIEFIRYRGTAAVKVGDNDAYAFPTGVVGLFITRFAPANYVETVNTTGLPVYAKSELMPMGKGMALEAQSNPLNLVTRPAAVIPLTLT